MACQAKRWCAREHEYRQTNAGKHWSQYVDFCRRWLPFVQLHKLLRQTIESKVSNGSTVENITVEYAKRAAIVARHPVIFAREQAKFVVSTDVIIGVIRALAGKSRWYTGSECQGRYQVLYKRTLEQNAANVDSLLAEFKLLEGAMKISARSEILSCALLLEDGPTHEHTSLYGTLRIQLAQTLVSRLDAAELELNDEVKAMLRKWKTSPGEYVRGIGWKFDNAVP